MQRVQSTLCCSAANTQMQPQFRQIIINPNHIGSPTSNNTSPFFYHSPQHFPPRNSLPLNFTQLTSSTLFTSRPILQNGQHIDHHLRNKQKRHTLPTLLSQPNLMRNVHSCASPPFKTSNNSKIFFSYNVQKNNLEKQLQFVPQSNLAVNNKNLTLKNKSQVAYRKLTRKQKQIRIKICSNQFNLGYAPERQSYKMNKVDGIALGNYKSLPYIKTSNSSINSTSRTKLSRNDWINQSKMASTEATQSFLINRKSDFQLNLEESKTHHNHSNQQTTRNKIMSQKVQPTLLSQLPSAKILTKTIMISNNAKYDFGGLITVNNPLSLPTTFTLSSQKQMSIASARDGWVASAREGWVNIVDCLLNSNEDDDMKQSIHCGPDTRHQRIRCQFLNGFGRQIKESCIS